MPVFPRQVFPAVLGCDLVLLDADTDRYVAVPEAFTEGGEVAVSVGLGKLTLKQPVADALAAAGLLAEGIATQIVRPAPPHRVLAHSVPSPLRISARDLTVLAISLAKVGGRMRRGLPCTKFQRRRPMRDPIDECVLSDVVGRLADARILLPSPRRCLPASVLAAVFLRTQGVETEIVFGVRSHPFEAHCWVERDGNVLLDELERVRAYTPLAVGLL